MIRHPNREDRSFRREASPNRLMSALLNGRSHARLNADVAAGFVDACRHMDRSAAQLQGRLAAPRDWAVCSSS